MWADPTGKKDASETAYDFATQINGMRKAIEEGSHPAHDSHLQVCPFIFPRGSEFICRTTSSRPVLNFLH